MPTSSYFGRFRSGGVTKKTVCHVTTDFAATPSGIPGAICNFTDERTGFPWFCVKPDGLSCDAYVSHTFLDSIEDRLISSQLSEKGRDIFK